MRVVVGLYNIQCMEYYMVKVIYNSKVFTMELLQAVLLVIPAVVFAGTIQGM